MAEYRIGISGWRYPPWRKRFFPEGLPQREELAYASRQVSSIEINGTFYSLQRPSSFQSWYEQTPEGFMFSVKCPRFITHIKRLGDVDGPLANFFASGVLQLEEKLGPMLWQLPPSFRYDAKRLDDFFARLPRDTAAAARLAKKHDHHISSVWTKTGESRPLRHALEVRHKSFETPEFIALLREHDVALVVADTAGKWPLLEDVTSDFIYVRLHGDEELYVSGYTPEALQQWARKMRAWHRGDNGPRAKRIGPDAPKRAAGRDVYVYFDNDVKIQAPYDAMSLAHRLGLRAKPEAAPLPATVAEKPRQPSEWRWRRSGTTTSAGGRNKVHA